MAKNDLITQLNSEYRRNQGYSPAKREKITGLKKLRKLKKLADSDESFDMFADYSNHETGDMWHYDSSGILYILSADEIRTLYPSYVPYGSSYLLGQIFKVKIKSVDEEEEKVYLSAVSCDLSNADYLGMSKKYSSLSNHAERLKSLLFDGIGDGKDKVVVRVTVTEVEKDRIFVDIFDTGIIGVIPVKNYAEQYRRDLRDCVMTGDSLKGVVFAYRAREGSGEPERFLVSTAGFLTDPWKHAENFNVGDTIVVKCVEKRDNLSAHQQYFFGVSPMLPNIDIMCDFTRKIPASKVEEGRYYSCKITELKLPREVKGKEKPKMKLSPFKEASSYDEVMNSKNSLDNI